MSEKSSTAERFWSKVRKGGPDECWLWLRPGHPYGQLSVRWMKRPIGSHRLSWMMENGPIPDGLYILHKCDNPLCVNPAHLFLGTHLQNVADRIRKGRDPRGEKHHASKLTDEQAREILRRLRAGEKGLPLSREFGISLPVISAIKHGTRRKHLLVEESEDK